MTNNLTYEQALLLKTDLDKSGINYLVSDDEDCQSALKSIHLTASNNVQQESKVIPFLAPFYAA
jgi:hypothetical protein